MKKLVLVGLVLALSGGSVEAAVAKGRAVYSATALAHKKQFEAGLAAYNSGDFETAVGIWAPLAEQGVGSAQSILGFMYSIGEGVPQDYAAAANWCGKAAERGEAIAQFNLGGMYEDGQGVPQDFVQAHKWFNLSAAGAI